MAHGQLQPVAWLHLLAPGLPTMHTWILNRQSSLFTRYTSLKQQQTNKQTKILITHTPFLIFFFFHASKPSIWIIYRILSSIFSMRRSCDVPWTQSILAEWYRLPTMSLPTQDWPHTLLKQVRLQQPDLLSEVQLLIWGNRQERAGTVICASGLLLSISANFNEWAFQFWYPFSFIQNWIK